MENNLSDPISNLYRECLKSGTMQWQNTIVDFSLHGPPKIFCRGVEVTYSVFKVDMFMDFTYLTSYASAMF
jgi:hypothetical protein